MKKQPGKSHLDVSPLYFSDGFILDGIIIVIAADLVIEVSKEDAEERTQHIEEGKGYILQGWNAQYP